MLHKVMAWLLCAISSASSKPKSIPLALPAPSNPSTVNERETPTLEHAGVVAPYDENLLEYAKSQWQAGNWSSLAAIEQCDIEQHPERRKLALIAAAGRLQVGAILEARNLLQLAQQWGCSKRLIAQLLISSTYTSLGRAAQANHQDKLAQEILETANKLFIK